MATKPPVILIYNSSQHWSFITVTRKTPLLNIKLHFVSATSYANLLIQTLLVTHKESCLYLWYTYLINKFVTVANIHFSLSSHVICTSSVFFLSVPKQIRKEKFSSFSMNEAERFFSKINHNGYKTKKDWFNGSSIRLGLFYA